MTIARPRMMFTVALGLVFSGLGVASVLAAGPGHSHDAGHDHGAMKAEQEIGKSLATLAPADQAQAVAQRFCPMMESTRLGADGAPHKVVVAGTSLFVCCEGCVDEAVAGGKDTLAKVAALTKASATLASMPAADRAAAEAQKYCAVANKNLLGSMGTPVKLQLNGTSVFLCCKGCVRKAKANPAATLAKVASLKKAGGQDGHDHKGGHDHKDGHDHKGGHKH